MHLTQTAFTHIIAASSHYLLGQFVIWGPSICRLMLKKKQFDYDSFAKDTQIAVRFLDNVIDDTYYFYKENEKVAKDIRKTGFRNLGIGGRLN